MFKITNRKESELNFIERKMPKSEYKTAKKETQMIVIEFYCLENADKRNTRLLKNETQIKCEANKDFTYTTQTDTKQHNKTDKHKT